MASIEISRTPAFTVVDREGNATRQEITEFPFKIGRQSGNHLLIRDARASRHHAHVTVENGEIVIEDLQSRHGVWVNGERIQNRQLEHGDRIEFGFDDSYRLVYERPGNRLEDIATHLTQADLTSRTGTGGNLARLRAMLEVTRALQSSFSIDSVLDAVVDAALVITSADRGFLLLKNGSDLDIRCARDHRGALAASEFKVPQNLIRRALDQPGQTFSIQFGVNQESADPSASAYDLALKSAVCIPLLRIQLESPDEAPDQPLEKTGVLYLDSRIDSRDMSAGNRELLETLAIEASTVLENARLLQDERARRHLNEELSIARDIQQSLLPRNLPRAGWFHAAGSSLPSREVGGDYFDLFPINDDAWAVVVADVAGKGVSSALVASLLQGAFLALEDDAESLRHTVQRVNTFFQDRTNGQKYATLFCGILGRNGLLRYLNAGHCAPVYLPINDVMEMLNATGPPVGLLDHPEYTTGHCTLGPRDRLIIYSDGITEAQNAAGEFFGKTRLKQTLRANGDRSCSALHDVLLDAVQNFTGGQEQSDDLTLLILEYTPGPAA
jgi:sigma-B regulation protein RsbU (phosphoserine phosphatase)